MLTISNTKIEMNKKEITAIAKALEENAKALRILAEAIKNNNAPSYGIYVAGNASEL